jgi:uncharacterized glyoxalase superfamily metalloenzyme YdcJ
MAEKVEMVERWVRREPLDSIARDYGVSPGMVSTIAIQEFGHPPHRISKRHRAALEAMEPPAEAMAPEAVQDAPLVPETVLMASAATLTHEPAPDLAALVEEVRCARREVAEMRREVGARLAGMELAMMRLAAKKGRRHDDPVQLAWPFGH